MTSASELFCKRRSRLGRESESGPDWSHCHPHLSNRRHQSDRIFKGDGRVSGRRTRAPEYRTVFNNREPIEVDEGTIGNGPANNGVAGESGLRNRPSIECSGSERLPGAVLQAKERLLQRLRGVADSDRRFATNVCQRNNTSYNGSRIMDARDWEIDIFPRPSHRERTSSSSIFHSELDAPFLAQRKPPGLSQEALDCLPKETFNGTDSSGANKTNDDNAVSWDCNICLERFCIGNKLIRLSCSHGFHEACLSQWVQICGDCPCCRSSVI